MICSDEMRCWPGTGLCIYYESVAGVKTTNVLFIKASCILLAWPFLGSIYFGIITMCFLE